MIAFIVGEKLPKTCKECPLFDYGMSGTPYCKVKGKYTEEEITSVKDGRLKMYYNGYIDNIPKNCPLVEICEGKNEVTHG